MYTRSCHTRASLSFSVPSLPSHCPAITLQDTRTPTPPLPPLHTAPKTPSVSPQGTKHPSLSLYIRSPPSITPICRIINDLVRNNPNTLRPHHRSETNPTASPASTTLGDSPQQQVLLSRQVGRPRQSRPRASRKLTRKAHRRPLTPRIESCPHCRHGVTVCRRPCGGKAHRKAAPAVSLVAM